MTRLGRSVGFSDGNRIQGLASLFTGALTCTMVASKDFLGAGARNASTTALNAGRPVKSTPAADEVWFF